MWAMCFCPARCPSSGWPWSASITGSLLIRAMSGVMVSDNWTKGAESSSCFIIYVYESKKYCFYFQKPEMEMCVFIFHSDFPFNHASIFKFFIFPETPVHFHNEKPKKLQNTQANNVFISLLTAVNKTNKQQIRLSFFWHCAQRSTLWHHTYWNVEPTKQVKGWTFLHAMEFTDALSENAANAAFCTALDLECLFLRIFWL